MGITKNYEQIRDKWAYISLGFNILYHLISVIGLFLLSESIKFIFLNETDKFFDFFSLFLGSYLIRQLPKQLSYFYKSKWKAETLLKIISNNIKPSHNLDSKVFTKKLLKYIDSIHRIFNHLVGTFFTLITVSLLLDIKLLGFFIASTVFIIFATNRNQKQHNKTYQDEKDQLKLFHQWLNHKDCNKEYSSENRSNLSIAISNRGLLKSIVNGYAISFGFVIIFSGIALFMYEQRLEYSSMIKLVVLIPFSLKATENLLTIVSWVNKSLKDSQILKLKF